jgi:hypothetical protein
VNVRAAVQGGARWPRGEGRGEQITTLEITGCEQKSNYEHGCDEHRWIMTSEVSVLPSTSMGMRSHMPLAITTLASTVAATSFKGPTTNRSRMSGTSSPASISLLPLF